MPNDSAKMATPAATGNNAPLMESSRNIWIYTGYVAAALALLGALAYHFSSYVIR